jgi:two-component system, NarL family, nitrate/nitrite response regulator NarL
MTLAQDTLQPEPQSAMGSPERARAVTTLAVDDHPGFLEALEDLIAASPDFVLVGEALSGEDAVRDAERLSPQLILMDVVMPGMGGIAAARAILSHSSDVGILLISVEDPVGYLGDEDLGRGVACLRKQDLSPSELKHAWELLHH